MAGICSSSDLKGHRLSTADPGRLVWDLWFLNGQSMKIADKQKKKDGTCSPSLLNPGGGYGWLGLVVPETLRAIDCPWLTQEGQCETCSSSMADGSLVADN